MNLRRHNRVLALSLTLFALAACDKTYNIKREITSDAAITLECVTTSAQVIGIEARQNNDIYNRPLEEYFSVGIRRGTTGNINTSWSYLKPRTLRLEHQTIGRSDAATQQAVCDLMVDYTDSFAASCAGGEGNIQFEDSFNNTSCQIPER